MTIRTAARYSAGLQTLLPKGHPVRAVALGELGKLVAVDEPSPSTADPTSQGASSELGPGPCRFPPSGPARLKLAYDSFVRAHEELLIGFGRADGGGRLGAEVRDAIVRLEKEFSVWISGMRNVLQDVAAGKASSPSSK